ncbi:MAG: glutathione S-transferase family protein [Pseudorhodoplanes sp.]|uniref:glutathione S-transferase family protein n=1 Tax=Pseudorhodoplanes sp. TaxID=1934341 RepID=UPI003D104E5F
MSKQDTQAPRTGPQDGSRSEQLDRPDRDIILYHFPISTCSQKVRLALAEKKLGYESRIVDLLAGEQTSEAYLAVNPNGVVPTLVHDGHVVVDSSVICEYLDDVFPNPPLGPASSIERARMRAWMRYLEEVPTVAIRAPSLNKLLSNGRLFSDARPGGDAFAERTGKMPLRKHFYREMGPDGFRAAMVEASLDSLRSTLERAERALDGSPYLIGAFSMADILLLPTVVRMEDLKIDGLWHDLPNVANWYARCKARPSFDVAYFSGCRLPN